MPPTMEILAEKFEQLKIQLKEAKRPLLVIHPKPDADALGAAFSLAKYLENKTPSIFCLDQPGKTFFPLFPISKVETACDLKKHDLIIFIDRGDVYFKLKFDEKIKSENPKISIANIDHHHHTFIPGALNIIDTKAAATSEIIFRFFEYVGYDTDAQTAQFLMSGIFADTGGFRHNNTTPASLEITSQLMKKGASITRVNRQLFANKSINTLKLWAIALERAQINPKTGMVVSFITKQDLERCGADSEDISGIAEILNTIAGSKFSLVISEREQNRLKASLRSEEYKGIDVSQIAREFLGGGHKLASGFEIKGRLRQVGDSWIIE